MRFYSFHIGDYASKTKGLSLLEDLAFRRIIDNYHLVERSFNGCSTDVARQIGMRDNVDEVDYVLHNFFYQNESGDWVNDEIEAKISAYKDKKDKASKAGKASAARRFNECSTDVQQTFNECSTDVQPTINHKPLKKNNNNKSSSSHECSEKKFDAVTLLSELGVSESISQDWITLRKAKKAPVTQTSIKTIKSEADKAKLTLEQALSICCKNGWQGFNASWVKPEDIPITKETTCDQPQRMLTLKEMAERYGWK